MAWRKLTFFLERSKPVRILERISHSQQSDRPEQAPTSCRPGQSHSDWLEVRCSLEQTSVGLPCGQCLAPFAQTKTRSPKSSLASPCSVAQRIPHSGMGHGNTELRPLIPPSPCSHWESCPSLKRSACSRRPLTCHSKLSSTTTTLGSRPTSRSPDRIKSGNTRLTLSWCTMLVWYVSCEFFHSIHTFPLAGLSLTLPLSSGDRYHTTSLGGWIRTRTP